MTGDYEDPYTHSGSEGQLALLQESVEQWNNWRRLYPEVKPRLKGADLRGADLAGAQLQGADLRDVQLQGADLRGALLQGVDLWLAQLQGADLTGAQLQGARLWQTQMQGVCLNQAWLQGADLWQAQLQGACLEQCRLQGADLWTTQLQGVDSNECGISCRAWPDPLRQRANRDTDMSGVHSQLMTNEDKKSLIQMLISLKQKEKDVIRKYVLNKAIQRVRSATQTYKLTGAITGTFSQEEAEEWIRQYNVAMKRR